MELFIISFYSFFVLCDPFKIQVRPYHSLAQNFRVPLFYSHGKSQWHKMFHVISVTTLLYPSLLLSRHLLPFYLKVFSPSPRAPCCAADTPGMLVP